MTYRRVMRLPWLVALVPLAACGPDESGGACKDSFVAGDLVVTEVMADFAAPEGGTGTDDGKEWFEIYNNTDRPVSLKGVTVVHSKADGSKPSSHIIDDVTIAPGQFFTLGNATQDLLPAYVDYGFSADLGDFYNTGGGQLALKCGDKEIDSAIYDSVKSGHTRQLTNQSPPDYTLNDDQVNWCEAKDTEYETNNFGTPGADNDCAPVIAGACSDSGVSRPVMLPSPGDLVITELMQQPVGTDSDQEWFELKATNNVDLNGLGIDRTADTTTPFVIESATCINVQAGTYVVVARSADMLANGGLPAGAIVATYTKPDLVTGTTTLGPGDLTLVLNGTVIDAVSWTSSFSGDSMALDPDLTDATSNDSQSNFCAGVTSYGAGGNGTPGGVNGQCASMPPAGKCDMGGGNFRDIVKPDTNALVITEVMPNPACVIVPPATTCSESPLEWFEITNAGTASFDLNGLGLDRPGDTTPGSGLPSVVSIPDCKPLAPGSYALFAKSADSATNGGMNNVDATFALTMVNSNGGQVQVVDPTTCTGSPPVCTTIYDVATWGTAADGVSQQLQPTMLNPTANDTAANYCPAKSGQVYGSVPANFGTPKLANVCM